MATDGTSWLPVSLGQLLENDLETFSQAARVLLKCADNILAHPADDKFRRLPVANKKIQHCLIPAFGAIECLFEMGFVEDGDHFLLPLTASIVHIRKFRNTLKKHFDEKCPVTADRAPVPASLTQNQSRPSPNTISYALHASEQDFYMKLLGCIKQVSNYLNPSAQEKARSTMPLRQLKDNAEKRFRELDGKDCCVGDLLLMELLGWFKESFFHWMNSPSCSACGGATQPTGHVAPLPEESAHQANRVEQYRCQSCGNDTRFPRYNDPCRLLETRVGRCGEWANCFTLLCIAAGLEARYVMDWTDHVWTEVYSPSQKRWLHADPCENVCDRPLLYEAGWGKKLTYVIAFSPYDIQDVTWRYTAKPAEVLARRTACREEWLVSTIVTLRQSIQQRQLAARQLTEAKLKELSQRAVAELVELMSENKSDANNLGGRTTGSVEWRQARGELGAGFKSHIITPSVSEIKSGALEIKYSCSRDEYTRVSEKDQKSLKFKSLAFDVTSMFRKEENDWKMAYLARQPGTETGSILWKISLSPGLSIGKMEIKVDSKCYEDGRVRWTVCGNDQCAIINPGSSFQTVEAVQGCSEVVLKAVVSGGGGENAWQHAQLFRQSLTDTDSFPFHIRVQLNTDRSAQ